MNVKPPVLLEFWRDELQVLMPSHYTKSVSARRLNSLLGVPVILIAMAVAGSIFLASVPLSARKNVC